jgi:ATP-independent RNA helicase DbpA
VSSLDFSSINLSPALLSNLASMGYLEMTPIQAQSLPEILQGKDVIAQGKTGSGKTAAFGLGLLHNLDVKKFRVQALVLCPTRELADQVAQEIRKLARAVHNIKVLTLCGGTPVGPQIGSLEHGAHIIVGTPGRIEDHCRKERLDLSHVNTLVLDEADRMLEMGFQPALDYLFSLCPSNRQTLLFSATFPEQILPLTQKIMHNPVEVRITDTHSNVTINQRFFEVGDNASRLAAVELLLLHYQPESAVVFCTTKIDTQGVADELKARGFSVLALHGDLEQRDRDQTLIRFANKSISVLVATDVAARGLDIDNLDAVINFHLSLDPEVHVHRIGRTGRAGAKGIAISLVSHKDTRKVMAIEEYTGQHIEPEPLPNENALANEIAKPTMVTLQLDAGKKQKIRPGDILGALTGEQGISGDSVGKIKVLAMKSYVAVKREAANIAMKKLESGKIKGKNVKVRKFKS